MQTVVVVDYGMGNLRSVQKALEHVADRARVVISSRPEEVRAADRVVFPGQGAMPDCMHYLAENGLEEAVREAAACKPFFGICVGMQILFDHSEEGNTTGLGLFAGKVTRFLPDAEHKVPHMGWNQVAQTLPHPLWSDIDNDERFYFVHSYFCTPTDPAVSTGVSRYTTPFTAALSRDNIFATQFHPEKSHRAGLTLYKNFLDWSP